MPDTPTPTPEPESAFVCDCAESMRSACEGESFYRKHEGKRYCVLHFPGEEKGVDFKKVLLWKLDNKDFNFAGVWFPDEVSFHGLDFSEDADFRSATFSGEATFGGATFRAGADFSSAAFSVEAIFRYATFSGAADFKAATFNAGASFSSARFSGKADFFTATFKGEAHLHAAKFSDEANFSFATFSAGADFRSATFSGEATFRSATFSEKTIFNSGTFSGFANFAFTTFRVAADFYAANFRREATFRSATFSGKAIFNSGTFAVLANFDSTTFSGEADFYAANFNEAYFHSATFSKEGDFSDATFTVGANFNSATFANHVRFAGSVERQVFEETCSLDLQFAKIEKHEYVSFHTVTLRPHWFVNVDASEFDFTNVGWALLRGKAEVASLRSKNIPPPLLAMAYRRLARNAKQNGRDVEASRFRYRAMDARRREMWFGFTLWRLEWWYWVASGYGRKAGHAFLVLIFIWLFFALIYTQLGFAKESPDPALGNSGVLSKQNETSDRLNLPNAVAYSLAVIALQKPEPKPKSTTAKTVVLIETILGPLQAALFFLAIRRKFHSDLSED